MPMAAVHSPMKVKRGAYASERSHPYHKLNTPIREVAKTLGLVVEEFGTLTYRTDDRRTLSTVNKNENIHNT